MFLNGEDNDSKMYGNEYILFAINNIRRIALRLRALGLMTAGATFLHFILVITAVTQILYLNTISYLILSVSLTACVTTFIVLFDMYRKDGDSLYEEISDELQWNIRSISINEPKDNEITYNRRPAMEYRLILRQFLRANDMPFISGRLGPAVYIAMNWMFLFGTALLYRYPHINTL